MSSVDDGRFDKSLKGGDCDPAKTRQELNVLVGLKNSVGLGILVSLSIQGDCGGLIHLSVGEHVDPSRSDIV